MSIFVSIPSYRDEELLPTVMNMLSNADSPDDIHVAIFDQGDEPIDILAKNTDYHFVHYSEAQGPAFARKKIYEMYSNEEYAMLIDSHMRFEKSWDTNLISMYNQAQIISNNEKILMSHGPLAYHPVGYSDFSINKEAYQLDGRSHYLELMNNSGQRWSGKTVFVENNNVPIPTQTVVNCFVFFSGKAVEEIPFDERIPYTNEEICFAVRAYTRGWDLYAPANDVVRHFYLRDGSHKIWEDNYDWVNVDQNSKEISKNVLCGVEQGVFGIIDNDRYEQYQKMVGINFKEWYGLT